MNQQKTDSNFIEIIKILNGHKIKYWICQGTLLGIVRDNQLIPWDHDIDIAVWSGSISKEKMIKIMISNNFTLRSDHLKEMEDLLTFTKSGGREVDINFYEVILDKNTNKKMAYANWYIPKNFFCKIIEALSMAKSYRGRLKYLIKLFYFFEPLFYKLKVYLIRKNFFYRSAGYTQPVELLEEFKEVAFHDITLTIPKKYEEYLNYVYGKEWKTTKRKYDWTKDSPSTIKNLKDYHKQNDNK